MTPSLRVHSDLRPHLEHAPTALPSILERFPQPSTQPRPGASARKIAFRAGLLAIPAAVGLGWALRSRRAGIVAGGLAALALTALRWQLARWFAETPAYTVDAQVGALELRTYSTRIEARAELDAQDFQEALDLGFGRLACYLFGANTTGEDIAMTTPVIMTLHDGKYTMGFVMPPGRTIASLPLPEDPRVFLCEAPVRRVAVLPFRGRFTSDNVAAHERRLLQAVTEAGLAVRGHASFAAYDSPATLPLLRRNEISIEIV